MAASKSTSKRKSKLIEETVSKIPSLNLPLVSTGLSGVAGMVLSNPVVIDTASSLATTVITKIATTITTRYPQLAKFVREGMVSLEAKLHEYNVENGMQDRGLDASAEANEQSIQ